MRSSLMSNKSSQDNDYEMAKFLAEAIGLADHPPVNLKNNAFVVNTITRRQKERKLHQSDFKHLEDQHTALEVKRRSRMIKDIERAEREKSQRKNSVKDVYISLQKPQNNPKIITQTHRIIVKNEKARQNQYKRQSQKLSIMFWQKKRRSKILRDLSSNLDEDQILSPKPKRYVAKSPFFFRTTKTNTMANYRARSFQKLANSIDLSKFNLYKLQGGLHLQSKESRGRTNNSSQSNRNASVKLKFNQDNKCEIFYADLAKESSSNIPFCFAFEE